MYECCSTVFFWSAAYNHSLTTIKSTESNIGAGSVLMECAHGSTSSEAPTGPQTLEHGIGHPEASSVGVEQGTLCGLFSVLHIHFCLMNEIYKVMGYLYINSGARMTFELLS